MSAEIMTIVLSAVGIVVATVTSMFSGLVWIVRRMDAMWEGPYPRLVLSR